MKRTYEQRADDLRIATSPIRDKAISIVTPIIRRLNDRILYCSLYIDKQRMDKKGRMA